MPNNDYILKLFNLQGVSANNLIEDASSIKLFVSSSNPIPNCSCCGKKLHIHDYRIHTIKAGKFHNKNIFIILKKRRFSCPCNNKNITETFNFISKKHTILKSIIYDVFLKLEEPRTMTSVAHELNISISSVVRYFDIINYSQLSTATTCMSIDEFKGNSGGYKYNAIITDPSTHTVLDVLKSRDKFFTSDYFSSLKNKENTRFFHQDMWKNFKDVIKVKFENAIIVADKYHYIRQVYWAMEDVRKREQKKLCKDSRLFFKRSKSLLKKDINKMTLQEYEYLQVMFSNSEDLHIAYELKELFKDFIKCDDYEKSKRILTNWILTAEESNLPEFKPAITAFRDWYKEICNSKLTPITNGFTEGVNNKIKVLKRVTYGMRNFRRFRNRILHMFNKLAVKTLHAKF